MNLSFEYINLLWLLLLLPFAICIFFYALYKKKQTAKLLGDANLVQLLTKNYNSTSYFKKFILLAFALIFIVLTVANLRAYTGAKEVNKKGVDVMIALDVSKSMLAKDVPPNRLIRAKQILYKLIDKLDNGRIGVVIFAGKAYLQMPLTADYAAAKMFLSAANPESVPTQGTVIKEALNMSYAAFNSKEKKYKSIILISDGEEHDEGSVQLAKEMAEQGVLVHTIGIGSPEGTNIFDEATGQPKVDNNGAEVITKLNEQSLIEIAKNGNGTYQLFKNADDIATNLSVAFAKMETKTITDKSLLTYKSWFKYLLGFALLFLFFEFFISEVNKRNVKTKKYVITNLFVFCFAVVFGQNEKALLKTGNDFYKTNNFESAITAYENATKLKADDPQLFYNLGNALYKANKTAEAIKNYDNVIKQAKQPTDISNALYNKGVVQQKENNVEQCIDTYKKALLKNPTNEDARHNLQLALQQQKQNNKKEPEKEKDKKDKKDKPKEEKPKPSPSNISKKDAEQKLNALAQKEKALQDKLHKTNAASPNKQEKDW
jgi:tetratricopeptide (TPR) repeat protein